jgi:hypothetical protein
VFQRNLFSSGSFRKNHLYYIRYAKQEKVEVLSVPDTLVVEMDTADLDSLYAAASHYLKLARTTNASPDKILPPPVSDSEWEQAAITLDLGFRGDKYAVSTGRFRTMKNLRESG